jgi:hypothetical protein
MDPGVFQLLLAPGAGDGIGLWAKLPAFAGDGGVDVQQRPVNVEQDSANRHSIKFSAISGHWNKAADGPILKPR